MDQAWTSAEAPRALDELFLKACALGAPCGDLATALAAAVVDSAGARLAVEVLAGGEHQIARATELAARVLDATRCDSMRSELAGGDQWLTRYSGRGQQLKRLGRKGRGDLVQWWAQATHKRYRFGTIEFAWDDQKAQQNLRRHKVRFEEAGIRSPVLEIVFLTHLLRTLRVPAESVVARVTVGSTDVGSSALRRDRRVEHRANLRQE